MQSMNASCEADCVHEEVAIADSERPLYSSGEVWKDQMVSWTDGATGETCAMTYDAIGNMRTKGSRTFEWKLGRKLAKVTEGALECSYDYDHTGNRVKKTVTEAGTTVTTLYRMAGDLLLSEKTGAETIWYEYDSGANLISMKLNGTRYFYIRNVQNDIVGLTDPNGNVVVRYEYNAWGKLLNITGSLAATVGVKNPFRYRGYYYDTETGLYYLKSRYYNPEIGRFISADG